MTVGTATVPRTVGPGGRIRSGLLVAVAAGTVGAASGWALLWWEQVTLVRNIARLTDLRVEPSVDQHHAIGFGSLVAGLALLTWLFANRPGARARRSFAIVGGTFVAWTVIAWCLLHAAASLWWWWWWPGPVLPDNPGDNMVHLAAPAAYLGPLVVLVAIATSVWTGSRFAASQVLTNGSADLPVPSRMASRVASGLVGAGVLVGIGGVATLVRAQWLTATPEGINALTSLADRQVILAVTATGIAWLVSGTGRGTTALILVAAAAVVGEDLTSDALLQVGAALLTIVTALVAVARRPLAATLDRLTL